VVEKPTRERQYWIDVHAFATAQTKRRPTERECSEGRRSCLLDGLDFRLHLDRTHVAPHSSKVNVSGTRTRSRSSQYPPLWRV